MIYFRIKELLKWNYWFIKNMEGGYQSLSHLMDNQTKAIHFETLEKMCDLFDCEIGELIEIKKDKRKELSKKK